MEEKELIPATIWHYTDLAGFLHIMQEGSWFYGTHYRHLSDKYDCTKGEKIFYDSLLEQMNWSKQQLPKIKRQFDNFSKEYSYYIGCFSAKNNSVNLWSNACFCIGFNSSIIDNILNKFNRELKNNKKRNTCVGGTIEKKKMIPVFYRETDYEISVKSYIDSTLELVELLKKHSNYCLKIYDRNPELIEELAHLRFLVLTLLKHKNFRSEEEKRVVYYVNDQDQRIEWIRGKPRIKLFPISNEMIKRIYVFDDDKIKQEQYKLIAQALCRLRSIDPDIVLDRINKRDVC